MNNTKLIRTLKHILKTEPKNLKMQRYTVAQILINNPTCKQLHSLREIVSKHNWEANIVDGNKKEAFYNGLKSWYYILISDMMMDIAKGTPGESIKEFQINNLLY